MKWAFLLVACAGIAVAMFNLSETTETSPALVSMNFELADAKQGELEGWRATMEICETAPEREEEFHHFGNGRRNFYFSANDRLLCQFSDEDAVNAFVDSLTLPRTHRVEIATRNGATQWTFGRIPARERH